VTADKEMAHRLKQSLEPLHISCFVAHDDIQPTREWQDEIENALRSMDALGALLTPNFHDSNWTDQEVGFAFGSGRLVLPLRFGSDPYGFIGKYQGYTIKSGVTYTVIAQEIASILCRHATTSGKMAEALVSRMEESWTWESSKNAMSMLEECSVITDDLLKRLENAKENNDQVYDAWGVPERISAFVKQHSQIGDA